MCAVSMDMSWKHYTTVWRLHLNGKAVCVQEEKWFSSLSGTGDGENELERGLG